MAETAQLTVRLDLEGNLSSGIQKTQRQLAGLSTSVGRAGKGIGQVGAGFAKAGLVVGGAALAGITGAAKAAIDFEDAFAGVRKTVDEADLTAAGSSFDQLALTFRNMATEIPIAATEFARLGETAGALGVNAADIDEFAKTTALLGVTTDLSADAAADALGRLGTILDFTGQDYMEFADSLVALGNAGASTESEIVEISKRFAAEGDAAGLATEQIAGLASATASLGFAPERGGTALSRVFANMGTNISLANEKGKEFADVTGRSIRDLQTSIDKGEGLGIFLDVLEGIRELSPTEANRTLKALGITNTSDRTIFRTMAQNLPFVNDQLKIAADATGALSQEAQKRFATVSSKIALLKNNITEAALVFAGDPSDPKTLSGSIGVAADKLSSFLKGSENRSDLQAIGTEVGKAINGIDFDEVLRGAKSFVGVLRTSLDVTLQIVSILNKLPTELKAAAVGFLAINKLSGGLVGSGVGNIVGGVGETVARAGGSRLPGIGKLFAQPVFVTNWPMGGLGGVPAGGGGGAVGTIGKVASVAFPLAALGTLMVGAAEVVGEPVRKLLGVTDTGLGTVKAEVAGVKLVVGASQAAQAHALQVQQTEIQKTNQKLADLRVMSQRTKDDTVAAQNRVRDATVETQRETNRGFGLLDQTTRVTTALQTGATAAAALTGAVATRTGSASVVGAIYANRPIITTNVHVNATTVSKQVTVVERYGTSGGSRNQNSNGSGTYGNGGR